MRRPSIWQVRNNMLYRVLRGYSSMVERAAVNRKIRVQFSVSPPNKCRCSVMVAQQSPKLLVRVQILPSMPIVA